MEWKHFIRTSQYPYQDSILQLILQGIFHLINLMARGIEYAIKSGVQLKKEKYQYSEIQKGYEIAKDQYVIIEKQDLEKIAVESTRTIDIKEFIDEEELDPLFVEKSVLHST